MQNCRQASSWATSRHGQTTPRGAISEQFCEAAAAEGLVNVDSQPHDASLTSGRQVSALLRTCSVQLLCVCLLGGGPHIDGSQTSQQPRCSVPSAAAAPAVVENGRCQLCSAPVTWQSSQQVLFAGSVFVLSTSHIAEGTSRPLAPRPSSCSTPSETVGDAHPVQRQPLLNALNGPGVSSHS